MYLYCKPPGGPRQFQQPYGLQFVEDRERQRIFVLLGSGNRNYRIIYNDGRGQKGQVEGDDDNPLYYGRAVGKWEGDTFVVSTTGLQRGLLVHQRRYSPYGAAQADRALHAPGSRHAEIRFDDRRCGRIYETLVYRLDPSLGGRRRAPRAYLSGQQTVNTKRRIDMRAYILGGLVASAMLLAVGPLAAHHSFSAEFDANKPITITGTVTKVEWTNPHVWFYVNVKDPKTGEVTNWGAEMGPPHGLQRSGWRRETLKIGSEITVAGSMAKNGAKRMNASKVTLTATGGRPGQTLDANSSQGQTP